MWRGSEVGDPNHPSLGATFLMCVLQSFKLGESVTNVVDLRSVPTENPQGAVELAQLVTSDG